MKSLYIFLFCFLGLAAGVGAQMVFQGEDYLINDQALHSGVAMGFTDLNGDALDDLVLLDETKELYVIYQTQGFTQREVNFVSVVSNSANWSLQVADVDNNGIQDIFTGGRELTIFMGEGMIPGFTRTTVNATPFLTQGSNFADMDADGDVDLFVCNDDAANFVALNDGNGNFTSVPTLMDFSTDPPSDGSGNYGTVWSDYDRDGDVDLYIAKCRLGTSPGDPERTNQFFENTPIGFQRMYDFPELLSNDQSWVADFIDVDNDGDWDLLLANHGGEPMNLFIQQDDGSFVDEAPERGIDFVAGVIQLVSGDYDNDGDVDVFAAGTNHMLFENDGTGKFSNGGFPERTEQIESATAGDYNNDGRLDIYAGYAHIYNNPSNIPDRLFTNNSNAGNYVKFSLRGETSNRFAIGSTIEIFHGATHQMREVRSGESYGINKTNIMHFGLGSINQIDSAKVFWPTGMVETYYNIAANSIFQITEGKGILEIPMHSIQADKSALCDGDTVILTGPVADEYLWSNGSTFVTMGAVESGMYTLQVRYGDQWVTLPTYQVLTESTTVPQIAVEGQLFKCLAEEVNLSSGGGDYPILWNTSSTDVAIDVSQSGQYYFTESRACGDYFSDTVVLSSINVLTPSIENDTVIMNDPAMISSNDPMTLWTADTVTQQILHTGATFDISSLTRDSLVFAASSLLTSIDPNLVGVVAPDINRDGYHNTALSGGMLFNTFEDCEIVSIDVRCRVAAPRTILILNADNNAEVYRQQFDLELGNNTLVLNAMLDAGLNYVMTTDGDENIVNLGFRSPDFMRSTGQVVYPFIGQSLAITESTFTTGQYYYFYNWQVAGPDKLCYSYWEPALAVVDSDVAIRATDVLANQVRLFPNPTTGVFNINIERPEDWNSIEVYDNKGKLIRHMKTLDGQLNNIKFESGFYALKFNHKNGQSLLKKMIVL